VVEATRRPPWSLRAPPRDKKSLFLGIPLQRTGSQIHGGQHQHISLFRKCCICRCALSPGSRPRSGGGRMVARRAASIDLPVPGLPIIKMFWTNNPDSAKFPAYLQPARREGRHIIYFSPPLSHPLSRIFYLQHPPCNRAGIAELTRRRTGKAGPGRGEKTADSISRFPVTGKVEAARGKSQGIGSARKKPRRRMLPGRAVGRSHAALMLQLRIVSAGPRRIFSRIGTAGKGPGFTQSALTAR
jgi:hypothetical protein